MFTGEEEHEITFVEGAVLTKEFRDNFPGTTKGGYFSQKAINEILDQQDCVGIRIYFSLDEDKNVGMVMVGVDQFENDQIGNTFKCMDKCITCPDRCGENDTLNSDM